MMDHVRDWHRNAVRSWRPSVPLYPICLQPELIPDDGTPDRLPLRSIRARAERLGVEMTQTLEAARDRASCVSVHRWWIEEAMEILGRFGEPTADQAWAAARHLYYELHNSSLYAHEREDVERCVRSLNIWADAMAILARAEATELRRQRSRQAQAVRGCR